MKRNLRDFVKANRERFDDLTPPGRIWAAISARLFGRASYAWWNSVMVWRSAAAIFFLLSAGLLAAPDLFQRSEKEQMMEEFQHVEAFYTRQITDRIALIEQHQAGLNGLSKDFQQLEAMYSVLREAMQQEPTKQVKDALELNLLVRVDLLNQRIQRLKAQGVHVEV